MPSSSDVLAWLWRQLRVAIPLALGCALFFSAMFREPFGTTLVYSFCITFLIQALVSAGRHGISRRLRLQQPGDLAAQRAWPGWKLMFPWIIASGVVGYFAGHALADLLTGGHDTPATFLQDSRALLLSMSMVVALSLGVTYFHYARGRMALMEARAQAAMRSAAENQLRLLESQLEPHMLFNTLANLRVLIGQDPQRAQAMLNHVIAFLRATLAASRSESHPLSSEFERIGDYLELMRVRMGQRLRTRIDLPAGLAALPVPPLLLQPLVENAILHGLEPKVGGGWIRITAQREGDMLRLCVRDTGVGLGALPPGPDCFGTQQVRERLAHLFSNTATFELSAAGDDEGGALATVRLPLP